MELGFQPITFEYFCDIIMHLHGYTLIAMEHSIFPGFVFCQVDTDLICFYIFPCRGNFQCFELSEPEQHISDDNLGSESEFESDYMDL